MNHNALLEEFRQIIREELKNINLQASDQWFDLNNLCAYVPGGMSKQTAYHKVSSGELPYHKKSRRLYFLKSEIDNYLKGIIIAKPNSK